MARLEQLASFEQELAHRLHLEHDYALSEALRAAIQLCDVLSYIVDGLHEKSAWLERRFKAAAKDVEKQGPGARILVSAECILQAEDPGLPDLLGAWSGGVSGNGHLRQLWHATEAFTVACYRQAIAQQLQVLS